MKKKSIYLFIALLAMGGRFVSLSAQTSEVLTNKKGMPILPMEKSFAIGFDALPLLQYAGNMFNGTDENGSTLIGFANQGGTASGGTLYGKYFLTDSKAIRARLSINQSRVQDVNRVVLDGQMPVQSNIEVEDELISRNFSMSFGGGMEWRKGRGRLVGVFGGELLLSLAKSSQEITYGNLITSGNQTPTSTTSFEGGASGPVSVRTISTTSPNSFGLTALGFAGVEYFVAPQISVGAEVTMGINYSRTKRSEVVTEEWDANSETVLNIKNLNSDVLTKFGIATGIWGGSINVMFHFK